MSAEKPDGFVRRTLAAGLLLCAGLAVPSAWAAPAPPAPTPCNTSTVCKSFELGPGGMAGTSEAGITNILTSTSHDGLDWESLFNAIGVTINNAGGTATFIRDDVSGDSKSATPDLTTFTSSGSDKNTDLVQSWNWGTTNVPAKTDITNAYILGVNDVNQDLLVFFGAERSAPNGSSYIDIELFQDEISLDRDPKIDPCPDAGCKFIGEHTAGDLLISMNFNNGGALGQVEFRKRNAANTGYDLILTLIGEGCNKDPVNGLAIGEACAFNNSAPINGGPWPNFDSQASVITTLPTNAFTEWGVNVSNALGSAPCFPTVQVKTRSSPSFTAELKDFAVRKFQNCNTSTVTQIHAGSSVGGNHNAADIQGTSVPLNSTVHDKAIVTGSDPSTDPTGTVTFKLFNNTSCTGSFTTAGTVALTGIGGGVAVAESPTSAPLAAGPYGYIAEYSGGGQYPASAGVCEPLTVNTADTSVNTDIKQNNINGDSVLNKAVETGTTIVDVATITGLTPVGPDPTGTLTFRRYATGNCSGSFSDEVINLPSPGGTDGIATAVSSTHTTTNSEFVSYQAIYSGDNNYSGSVSSVCEPVCSFTSTTAQQQQ